MFLFIIYCKSKSFKRTFTLKVRVVVKSALSIGAGSDQLSHIQLGAWSSPDEKGFGHGPLFADYIYFNMESSLIQQLEKVYQ